MLPGSNKKENMKGMYNEIKIIRMREIESIDCLRVESGDKTHLSFPDTSNFICYSSSLDLMDSFDWDES